MTHPVPTYILGFPEFLRKYIDREIEEKSLSGSVIPLDDPITQSLLDTIDAGSNVVMISSTEIYGLDEGNGILETQITDSVTPNGSRTLSDESLTTLCCTSKGCLLTIFRCPEIIGTGMQGRFREIINSIYRGVYHHIDDETARLSVVHAVDVARAAVTLGGVPGTFHLTDNQDPTLRELTDALAFRLDGKRIYTLRARRAKILAQISSYIPGINFDKTSLSNRYKSLTFSCEKIISKVGWKPTPVVDYLRTHVYDENSL